MGKYNNIKCAISFYWKKKPLTNQNDHQSKKKMSKWYKQREHKKDIQIAFKQIKSLHLYS